MSSPIVKLVYVAVGIAVTGTMGLNYCYFLFQKRHRNEGYCTLPYEALLKNDRAVKLLGGHPLKMTGLSARHVQITPEKAQLQIPMKGNTRKGMIHTMSTRSDSEPGWLLQYAVMHVEQGKHQWNVWLHPADGTEIKTGVFDEIPDDVKKVVST